MTFWQFYLVMIGLTWIFTVVVFDADYGHRIGLHRPDLWVFWVALLWPLYWAGFVMVALFKANKAISHAIWRLFGNEWEDTDVKDAPEP